MGAERSAAAKAEGRGLKVIAEALTKAGFAVNVQAEIKREVQEYREKRVSPWAIELAERKGGRGARP